ncbi:MAG: hypothetical protein M1826_004850 [Phylliscum demangeonii]|nr:MAG: hypothetical protein M1826_004850 [Phylliscum demangeonii]
MSSSSSVVQVRVGQCPNDVRSPADERAGLDQIRSEHAPYAPTTAALGEQPTKKVDVPLSSVFLALFLLGGITHMTILQLNRRRGHHFIMSGVLFGFCMARITTCALRIAWACHAASVSLAIAASIFVSAGVLLLFIINLIFAQRILRAQHPRVGWHRATSAVFMALYFIVFVTLVLLIFHVVQSYFTQSTKTHRVDRNILIYGGTYFAFIAFLPIPLVLISLLVPRRHGTEKFGRRGRFRSKIYILLAAAATLSLGAAFRAGTTIKTPRPRAHPAWYQSKACFYVFNFTIEVLVVYLYAVVRVDLRFHVPDGASKPGDYRAGALTVANAGIHPRVRTEEEVFDVEGDDNDRPTPAHANGALPDGEKERSRQGKMETRKVDEAMGLGSERGSP